MMQINDLATMAEVNAASGAYERALVSNDTPEPDRLFWDSPHTLRYGGGENLYGIEMIRAGEMRIGCQTQTRVPFQADWQVVAAHVSWADA